ncbi:Splicing factor 3A subunit 3, partial [Exaiptasia diaphana]
MRLRKEEVHALSGPNEFAEFYSRLRSLKEYHRKYPNEIAEPMQMEFLKLKDSDHGDENTGLVEFTDEEGYGKYLDLHEVYDMYLNLKGIERIDYLTYLDTFDRLFDIPKEKKTTDYKRYLQSLLDYLYGFFQRIEPLHDIDKELSSLSQEFEVQWSQGKFLGWQVC